jgi:cobalamin biosynthesis protein CobT
MDIIKEPDCIKFLGPPKLTDRDTVVALSIENSGSMRGRPITVAAKSADRGANTACAAAASPEANRGYFLSSSW